MNRAVIYTRVSLDATGEGLAVSRQEELGRMLATMRSLEVVEVCEDNSISAFSGKRRPGFERVMSLAQSGAVDVIITYAMDRLTRSMTDLERLILVAEERHVGVATVTGDIDLTNDVGRMVARILAAVARAEVERKGARQRVANVQRAKLGKKTTGFRPFGYEPGQMEVRESEARLIREAVEDVLAGVSAHAIAKRWNEAGVRSAQAEATGKAPSWTATSVADLLRNPRIAGLRAHNGVVVGEAQWPAIITPDRHEVLKARYRANRTTQARSGRKPTRLLTSIAVCGKCGGEINATNATRGKDGVSRPGYTCKRSSCVWHPADDLEKYIGGIMQSLLDEPEQVEMVDAVQGGSAATTSSEVALLEERLTGLASAYAEGSVTLEQMTVGTATLRERLSALEARLEALAGDDVLASLSKGVVWDRMTLERQRAVLSLVMAIELHPRGKGARGFKEDAVVWSWKTKNAPPPKP